MVAAKIATLGQGARTDLPSTEGMSQPDAGDLLSVGTASVERASKVVKQGTPELVAAVEAGAVSVSAAQDRVGRDFSGHPGLGSTPCVSSAPTTLQGPT